MHVINFYSDAGKKIGYETTTDTSKATIKKLLQQEGRAAAYAIVGKTVIINPLRKKDVVDSGVPTFLSCFCYLT